MSASDRALIPYRSGELVALALVRQDALVPVEVSRPEVAEGFLHLASQVLLQAKRREFKTIAVASANAHEGKTTVALNLAICLGRSQGDGRRVLLVDADTRGRVLTRLLGSTGGTNGKSNGVPRLLLTSFQGVDLLTAPLLSDALAMYDPDAWGRLLDALRTRYRLIVIDGPSVLGHPDGTVLPASADETLFVVRAGQTPVASVERALETLGREPLGVVLNGSDEMSGSMMGRRRDANNDPLDG